ncbi:MAG: hypothetical protein ACOCVR_02165 [Myxococcota bacterium]
MSRRGRIKGHQSSASFRALLLFVSAGILSCGSEPEYEPELEQNHFLYERSFDGLAGEETHTWPVSGARAAIDWEGTIVSEGELNLTISDAEGRALYSGRAVSEAPPTAVSDAGASGDWVVEISYTRLEGMVRVEALAIRD